MNELFGTNHFIKFKLTAKSNSYASAFWIMIRFCIYVIIPKKRDGISVSIYHRCCGVKLQSLTCFQKFANSHPIRVWTHNTWWRSYHLLYNTRRFVYVSLDIRVIHSLNSHILQRLRHDLFMQKKMEHVDILYANEMCT